MKSYQVSFITNNQMGIVVAAASYVVGAQVVVQTAEHQEIATIKQELTETENNNNQPTIIRSVTKTDLERQQANQSLSEPALRFAKKAIADAQLEMKLISTFYTLDRHKLIFNFTAAKRVDFRELVRELARQFKTRIELRQVGVRDEAKILGGIGPCGRQLCCHTFLGDFIPVSIKMAKNQSLSLNPVKISGLCGRLMCCLQYEDETYVAYKKALPDIGARVQTADGIGKVVGLNLLSQMLKIRLDSHQVATVYAATEVQKLA